MSALVRRARLSAWFLSSRCVTGRTHRRFYVCCSYSKPRQIATNDVFHERYTSTTPASSTTAAAAQEEALGVLAADRLLFTIDRNVRRFGRVSRRDIDNVVTQMEKDGRVADTQALLVIRCLGSIMAEVRQDERTSIVNDLWKKMQSLGAVYGNQHYNALLRVYLQNEHPFSPTDFLASMENSSVDPNRVTYQRLVARYCQDGDIQGASQILEHMKTKQLPINEQVFNSLITGHFKANDIKSAHGMIDIMKQAGMEPSIDTYGAFLQGYAEKGDLKGMLEVMEWSGREGITLTPNVNFSALFTLVVKGKESDVREFLPRIPKLPGYSTDATSCSLQLISCGYDDLAYEVFETMGKPSMYDRDDATLGRFLIRGMVRSERPPEKISEILQRMREAQFNNDHLSLPAQFALINKQTDYALRILEQMKKEGYPMRAHYFWPVLCQYGEQGDTAKLKMAVGKMKWLCDSNEDSFQTLHDYILPPMLKLEKDVENAISAIKSMGYKVEEVNFAYFIHLLEHKDFNKALQFGESHPVFVVYGALRPLLVPMFRRVNDYQAVLRVLKFCQVKGKSAKFSMETNGGFLLDFLQNSNATNDIKEKVIYGMREQELTISNADVEEIKVHLTQSNIDLSAEISDALKSIGRDVDVSWKPRQVTGQLSLVGVNQEKLEDLLKSNPDDKAVQKWLLSKYCQNGNVKQARELKEKLDASGFVYPNIVLRQLAFMETVYEKDLEAAISYFNQLKSQYPEFAEYSRVVLNISALQIEKGQPEEAVTTVEEYCNTHKDFIAEQKFEEKYMYEQDFVQVLKSAAKANNMALARQMLQLFFTRGLIKDATATLLRAYMDGFIESGDSTGAVEALAWTISTYSKTPQVDPLLQMLIRNEDPDNLQKVADLLTPVYGEMNILHQLMIAFIECGQTKKAKKIIDTPGLRAVMTKLSAACDQFVRDRRLKELDDLVSVTRLLFAVDRDEMLFQRIRYHALEKDWPKALNVLVDYEEEGVHPRPRTLRYLAKALKGNGQPVPFSVPEVPPEVVNTRQSSMDLDPPSPIVSIDPLTAEQDKAVLLLDSGGLSAVMDMVKERGPTFLTGLVTKLLEKKRFLGFRKLMLALANTGEVDSLVMLKGLPLSGQDLNTVNYKLFQAYINSNRGEEIMEHIESNPEEASQYISEWGITVMVEKHPAFLERLENIVYQSVEKGSMKAGHHLWSYYFCQGDTNKAEAILQRYPDLLSDLRVIGACKHSLDTNQEEKFIYLADLMRKQNKIALSIVYQNLISLHCKNQDSEAALKVVSQCEQDGVTMEMIREWPRRHLINLLKSQGKPVPVEISVRKAQRTETPSSESSSDSSTSDDESTEEKNMR